MTVDASTEGFGVLMFCGSLAALWTAIVLQATGSGSPWLSGFLGLVVALAGLTVGELRSQ